MFWLHKYCYNTLSYHKWHWSSMCIRLFDRIMIYKTYFISEVKVLFVVVTSQYIAAYIICSYLLGGKAHMTMLDFLSVHMSVSDTRIFKPGSMSINMPSAENVRNQYWPTSSKMTSNVVIILQRFPRC